MRARALMLTFSLLTLVGLGLAGCENESNVAPAGVAALTGYSNTPYCVRGGEENRGDGEYQEDPPKVEVLTDGLTIEIVHQNAWFKCCMDTILVDLRQEGEHIILTESEVVTMPCRCICPFRVTASVEVSRPGVYRIEIYALEGLIWTGRVEVTGD